MTRSDWWTLVLCALALALAFAIGRCLQIADTNNGLTVEVRQK